MPSDRLAAPRTANGLDRLCNLAASYKGAWHQSNRHRPIHMNETAYGKISRSEYAVEKRIDMIVSN